MSPPNKTTLPRLAVALVASLGLGGVAPSGAASPQEPGADAPAATAPASVAPSAPAAAPSPAPGGPPTFLLLTNGKVLQGEIQRTAAGYVLRHKIGVSVYPRSQVERTFRSVDEVFAYKKTLCPENDPDELLKLASWCLEQKDPKFKEEARGLLRAILELNPENRRARAILGNLDRPVSPASARDEAVVLTGAEAPIAPPGEVNLERLREEYARNPRPAGLPVIFDLDTPQAVRRYQEFSGNVHPILQRRCARCHNESTPNDFPLIQARTRRDLANDLIVRANLEATLRLIHRDDLPRSPLLTASGMTHGNGGQAVLGGPNSPEYRTLAAWATGLKPANAGRGGTGAAPAPGSAPGTPPGEAFAASRARPAADPAMPPASPDRREPTSTGLGTPAVPMRDLPPIPGANLVDPRLGSDNVPVERVRGRAAGRLVPGSEVGSPNNPPPDSEFQTPPLRMNPPVARPGAKGGKPQLPIGETADPKTPPPGTVWVPEIGEFVPVVTKAMTTKAKDDPAKKKKFDPKALDNFMKARPGGKP